MNIAAHFAPEELMAFLDGELSAKDAQAVSSHVDDCSECAKLVDQLQSTSHTLSTWKTATAPVRLEKSITEYLTKVESGIELRRPNLFIRTTFWTWKQYAVVGASGVLALTILAAVVTPNIFQDHAPAAMLSSPQPMMPYVRTDASEGSVQKLHQTREQASARAELQSSDGPPQAVREEVEPAPMIARTVSLSIVVKDFSASRSSLDTILARYHGYSAQLNATTTENAPRALQASLRIPAPALSSAVSDFKKLGRVENESQSGEEVTRQHADLVARLKNSRDTEQRLREILQQRTGKVGEVLEVEREIAHVRGEIESMEAEQKALEHRVDFATVGLQLTEEYKALLNPPADSISTRFHNAFVAGYHNALDTVIGILLFFAEYGPALLIWIAILASPFVLLWRRYRKIRALQA